MTSEIVLVILGAAALVVAVYLVRLLSQLSKTAAEAQRLLAHLNEKSPQVDRILAEAEGELADLRKVTQKVEGIADQVGVVTQRVARVAMPALDGVESMASPMKYISAAVAGVKVVMQLLRKRREEPSEELEDTSQKEKGT